MTRERAKELVQIIEAYGNGASIQWFSIMSNGWMDVCEPGFAPNIEYRIKPEPKKRLRTREEVLGFVANSKGMVISEGTGIYLASAHNFDKDIFVYEYAIVDDHGTIIQNWRKFEVEE